MSYKTVPVIKIKIKEPVTKPRDIWQLGPHRLMCGDDTLIAECRPGAAH